METIWKKNGNAASILFPDAQSLVIQRLEEEEQMSMALAESIISVQLEQFRLDKSEKNESDISHNESDNTWDTIHHNLPDSTETEIKIESRESDCHDNNNNTAKSRTESESEVKTDVQEETASETKESNEDEKSKDDGPKECDNTQKHNDQGKSNSTTSKNGNKTACTKRQRKPHTLYTYPKYIDKYGRIDGYSNRHVFIGKGTRMKEQDYIKQYDTAFNPNLSKSKVGLEDKGKSVQPTMNTGKTSGKINDIETYRDQSTYYETSNTRRNRDRAKGFHQKCSKGAIKSEPELSLKQPDYTSDSIVNRNKVSVHEPKDKTKPASTESNSLNVGSERKSESNKPGDAIHSQNNQHNGDEYNKNKKYERTENNSEVAKPYVQYKRMLKSFNNLRFNSERDFKKSKDEQKHFTRPKKESSNFKRSTEYMWPYRTKTNPRVDHKYNSNNVISREYKTNRSCYPSVNQYNESETKKTNEETSSNLEKINNTDVPDLSSNPSSKPENAHSNLVENSEETNSSIGHHSNHIHQKPLAPILTSNAAKVTKTEQQEHGSNFKYKETNGKASTEAKSVTFSDNIEEINISNYMSEQYPNEPFDQKHDLACPMFPDLQNLQNANNVQQSENYQIMQNRFLLNGAAHYNRLPTTNAPYNGLSANNIQYFDHGMQPQEVLHQNADQAHHLPPQNICNQPMLMTNGVLQCSNIPAMYMNQYNNGQSMPEKMDSISPTAQNMSSTMTHNMENGNLMQNHATNILMPGNQQTPVISPSFHNHPPVVSRNDWNLQSPDMLYSGNLVNATQSMNIQAQGSKPACNDIFNNAQTNYMTPQIFCVPSFYMQNWDPNLRYPTPYFQNSQYTNNVYCNQPVQPGNLTEQYNYPTPTYTQDHVYKHFHEFHDFRVPQLRNSSPTYMKAESYAGGFQDYSMNANNSDMRNVCGSETKAGQYKERYKAKDGSQESQFYFSSFHTDFGSKTSQNRAHMNENEYNIPPMISPKDYMIYGPGLPKSNDKFPNRMQKSEYAHSRSPSLQNRNSDYRKSSTYQDESIGKVGFGRGRFKLTKS